MRIILSRKGFDSSAGGCPSPIFPDGRLFSLPIPDKTSPIVYSEIHYDDIDVGQLVSQLTRDPKRAHHRAHLDPDLRKEALNRQPGWRPLLGQTGSTQGHLNNQCIVAGDIFLFFGSFRPVEFMDDRWRFIHHEPPRHVIWGWLQIGEILKVDNLGESSLKWARYHPHFAYKSDSANTLYLASNVLSIRGQSTKINGAGVFPHIRKDLLLTKPGSTKQTSWQLPHWFFPSDGISKLSFNPNVNRWSLAGNFCYLESASRGQEFVIDATGLEQAEEWILALLGETNKSSRLREFKQNM